MKLIAKIAVLLLSLCASFTAFAQTTSTNYSGMWCSSCDAPNGGEAGWGLQLVDHGTNMFAVWYGYGPDNKPYWYSVSGGTFSQDKRTFTGTLYLTTGTSYRLQTFDPKQLTIRAGGIMTLVWQDDTHATLSYNIDGVTVVKNINKYFFTSPPFAVWPNNNSDMWCNKCAEGVENGWGMTVDQQGDQMFVTMFVYDDNNHPLWLVVPGGTWTSDKSFTGNVYTTTGPSYTNPVFNANNVVLTPAGVATVIFNDRETATLSYTVNCSTVTKSINRYHFVPNEQIGGTMNLPTKLGAFVLAAGIAGCGGGGGGGSSPSIGQTAATVAVTGVTPANAATNVAVDTKPTLTFTVANGSYLSHTADFRCGGNTVAYTSAVSGNTITLSPSANLPLGQTCQINWSVSGSPVGNPAAQFTQTFTVKSNLSYLDKVYVTYVGGYPYSVSKTGVTKVTNKTQFTTGFFPLFNCSLYETPIEDGKIPVQCTTASDNVRRTFYINPLTEELFQYTGTFTFDSTRWHDVPWGTQPYGTSVGPLGYYAEVSDGIYWGPALSDGKLRFSPKNANGYDFNTVLIVAQGTPPDFFKIMIKYSF